MATKKDKVDEFFAEMRKLGLELAGMEGEFDNLTTSGLHEAINRIKAWTPTGVNPTLRTELDATRERLTACETFLRTINVDPTLIQSDGTGPELTPEPQPSAPTGESALKRRLSHLFVGKPKQTS